ncbi:MAG TPA: SAM-dependent methyltransferase [Thermodesulfovibrionales bacterium]|nr:SAM-dependent methyltransferase [Thermodesulfovibrionales bacterium]
MSFETFMEMCLYYPGLGYYMKDSTKIGRAGDFYTSPHLHSIFGAMMGRQIEEMWQYMGEPEVFHVVEMGAGMGHLAKDILHFVQSSKFSDSLRYTIVELNPSIKTKQSGLLADITGKVNWVSGLDELEPVTGCFMSNELLDAFPVRMVEMNDELEEIYVSTAPVTSDEDQLVEARLPAGKEIKEYLDAFGIELPRGYRTEVNLRLKNWTGQLSRKLVNGFVLTIDYGYPAWDYYGEDRSKGTLLCYYHHQVNEDPYQNIGEQDLTAHVNFSSLKKWGEESGLKTVGFCPQGTYLVSLGIDRVIAELYGDSPDAFEIAKIKGLLLPQGMGESHKVMIQYKGTSEPKLMGFAIRNQKGKL